MKLLYFPSPWISLFQNIYSYSLKFRTISWIVFNFCGSWSITFWTCKGKRFRKISTFCLEWELWNPSSCLDSKIYQATVGIRQEVEKHIVSVWRQEWRERPHLYQVVHSKVWKNMWGPLGVKGSEGLLTTRLASQSRGMKRADKQREHQEKMDLWSTGSPLCRCVPTHQLPYNHHLKSWGTEYSSLLSSPQTSQPSIQVYAVFPSSPSVGVPHQPQCAP